MTQIVWQDIVHFRTMLENYSAINPTQTPNWQGPNPYDTLVTAQIHAAIVAGVAQTDPYDQNDYFPLNSNSGYTIADPVVYDPSTGIRTASSW